MQEKAMSASLAGVYAAFTQSYAAKTEKHTKLIDVYLVFTLAIALVQFLYCTLVGNFPFNSFLAGFGCALGAFVLGGVWHAVLCCGCACGRLHASASGAALALATWRVPIPLQPLVLLIPSASLSLA